MSTCYISALCCIPFSGSFSATTDGTDRQREQGVALIRAGQVDKGLQQLRLLLARQPENQKLIADYLVSAYETGHADSDAVQYISHIQPEHYPEYGKVAVIKTLRDLKQMDVAEQWASNFARTSRQQDWRVWIAVLQAEAGKKEQAVQNLARLNQSTLTADYLAQVAYAYRLVNMPLEALNAATLAVERQPKTGTNTNIQEQYVLALIASSDYSKAWQVLQHGKINAERPALKHLVKLSEFSQRIQNAVQYYKVAMYKGHGDIAYQQLDEVLADMQAYQSELPEDKSIRREFYYNYIYALNKRSHAQLAVAQLSEIDLPSEQTPAYVRQALAESYLKIQKPALAEKNYKSLLNERNYADYSVYSGLYYSLIEQDRYKEANQLIQQMDKLLPVFRYSEARGVDRTAHDDRAEYLSLVGLNYAYQNQHARAEQYFKALVARAPNNIAYQNALALVQRWREKPRTSEQTLAQWNGIEPVDQSTEINHLQNVQALGKITEWRQQSAALSATVPNDTGVIKSRKELEDRQHASIQHQSHFSHSKADNSQLLDRLKGTREQSNWTRLASPWFAENYRMFIDHNYRKAKYDEGVIDDQRLGLGLEWAENGKSAQAVLSQSTDGDRLGLQLNWTRRLNDHWQYVLGFDSQASIPLQALRQDHEGKSYSTGFRWQENESRKAGLSYQLTDIDDGNTRQEVSAYFRQQLLQSAHHITRATLSGYYGKNDDVPVVYYNPKKSRSVELSLEHDWMTWRNYERRLNQHFVASVGSFNQAEYSSKAVYNLLYQHDWQLSRTWALNYGIGWGVHPYDGEDENKTYAVIGFEGRF
ncbi:poly-beta-1,6 N-acetyl-D-glucosamine export porin PgaA [Acinetobacter sp. WZC-1]|uniref:poly-beta-1,6 N-acetyl-D-glucosamine export porin PgaA n=1 Tax=Acinetobacter sp. WZC-1 TaxID=3459034 RepID=UPI00403DFA16